VTRVGAVAKRPAAFAFVVLAACSCAGGKEHLGRDALSHLSARERQALADERITFGEDESAVRAQVGCLRGLDVTVDEPQLSDDGTFQIGWDTSAGGAGFERLLAEAERCSESVRAVTAVYVLQHAVSDEERREGQDSFRDCVGELGLPGADDAGFTELLDDLRDRVVAGQIAREPATACQDLLRAVSVSPLPGLAEALDELEL